ncbi:IS3 family transposase [Mycoplasma bradburyae]|uniref:IS3 family transposase n=1 Tax=Mycoplasma bradburyae TaxID=2963128 RepID=UPI0023412120|nr:IS3 family transposase [Mycoplasma bradburyae]MDC4182945.1 IS3 family transposase [Mycoplasma bradburyae]
MINKKCVKVVGKLYLDPFIDLFNVEVISYSISKQPTWQNIINALSEVIKTTSDCCCRRAFHSEQGWVYQMKIYEKMLKYAKIFQSMSRKGNCLDNAVVEYFFSIIKQEIFYGKTYSSYEKLKSEIEKFIKYYNETRIKQRLGFKSAFQYQLNLIKEQKNATHSRGYIKSSKNWG